jgi:hypothetical protein
MAFMLVSLQRVKDALRIDTTDDDSTLEIYISAASLAVVEYLKGEAGDFLGIDSPADSPPNDLTTVDERVVMSVIILVGILFREPDGDEAKAFSHGNLPWMATALLYPLRIPTLA